MYKFILSLVPVLLATVLHGQTDTSFTSIGTLPDTTGLSGDTTLTRDELLYADSIARVNRETAILQEAQGRYNSGIESFENNRYGEAIRSFNQALELKPGFRDARYNRGCAYQKLEKYEDAVMDFSYLIDEEEEDPIDTKSLYRRGECYTSLRSLDKAKADYQRLTELEKQSHRPWYYLGGVLFLMNDMESALDAFNTAIDLNPDFSYSYNDRASCHRKMENHLLAIADLERAASIDPQEPMFYNNLGSLYKKTGDASKAISAYNRAIGVKKDYFEALNNRGTVFLEQEKYDEAISDFTEVIGMRPDYYVAYSNRGIAHFKLKNYEKALMDFNRAIEINPDYATAYLNRGILREATRDAEGCCSDYQMAAKLGIDYAGDYFQVECEQ